MWVHILDGVLWTRANTAEPCCKLKAAETAPSDQPVMDPHDALVATFATLRHTLPGTPAHQHVLQMAGFLRSVIAEQSTPVHHQLWFAPVSHSHVPAMLWFVVYCFE